MMRWCCFVVLCFIASWAYAWETLLEESVDGVRSWRSIYHTPALPADATVDHVRLSDQALQRLGVADLFGSGGTARLGVSDMNANYFRAELLDQRPFDAAKGLLERRIVPAPAAFSGMPDYSYTIYDWLNMHRLCPAAFVGKDCHAYMLGGLGQFSASHFGSQATAMYAHYHNIALRLATRARLLHEQVRARGETTRKAYIAAVKEAELEALLYEGYAQHFLQDRWSVDHMWERWGAGDVALLPKKVHEVLPLVTVISALAQGTDRQPMAWRHLSDAAVTKEGMVADGMTLQMSEMLECSMAGWAEVIRGFGAFEMGYGAWEADLASDAPDFLVLEQERCWDVWASNEALYDAFVGDMFVDEKGAVQYGQLARLAFDRRFSEAVDMGDRRQELVRLVYRLQKHAQRERDPMADTVLARGGLDALFGVEPGNAYSLPAFVEPLDFETLPRYSAIGRDRETLMGAFNRAHSDYWCRTMYDDLAELRGSQDPRKQALCEYMVDFVYQGTDREYTGVQQEQRLFSEREVASICTIREMVPEYVAEGRLDRDYNERYPMYIDQGYVGYGDDDYPTKRSQRGYSAESVVHWCAKVPVLDLSPFQVLQDENVVAELAVGVTRLRLTGHHFGEEVGTVWAQESGRKETVLGSVKRWSEDEITLDLDKGLVQAGKEYLLLVETALGQRSVGFFLLRIASGSS